MKASIADRVISFGSYLTMGFLGLIWIIFCYLTKKSNSSYIKFNIYQSMFLAFCLYIFSLVYGIAYEILSNLPFVGKILTSFDLLINHAPIFFGYTFVSFLMIGLLFYVFLNCLFGKRPYIPWISNVISYNFGV